MSQHDPAEDILKTVPVSARLKNQAWDAYWDAPDADALAARLRDMPLPNEVKDALWDAKARIASSVPPATVEVAGMSLPSIENVARAGTSALPAAGGLAGGLIGQRAGTPGAMAGAAIGGAGGEAFKQLLNRLLGFAAPGTPTEAATAIAKEAAIQGGSEAAGRGVAGAARATGKWAMENAVRPTMTVLEDFPTVIDTIIRERLPVGRPWPGLKKGSEQAAAKLGTAARGVRALLAKAEASGREFTASAIARPIMDLVDDIAKQPLSKADQNRLAGMLSEFLDAHPGPLTPTAVKDLKQRAWAIAKPVMKAERKGFPVQAEQAVEARFNRAIGTGAKEALETIPGVAQGEQRAQDLIGATRALKGAEARRLSLMTEGLSGAGAVVASLIGPSGDLPESLKRGITTWLMVRGLGSPRTLSRVGLRLTNRQAQALFRQFPRLAAEVVKRTEGRGVESPATPTSKQ